MLLKLVWLSKKLRIWVPTRLNIDDNEEVDRLARRESGSKMVGPELQFGVRPSTVKVALKDGLQVFTKVNGEIRIPVGRSTFL